MTSITGDTMATQKVIEPEPQQLATEPAAVPAVDGTSIQEQGVTQEVDERTVESCPELPKTTTTDPANLVAVMPVDASEARALKDDTNDFQTNLPCAGEEAPADVEDARTSEFRDSRERNHSESSKELPRVEWNAEAESGAFRERMEVIFKVSADSETKDAMGAYPVRSSEADGRTGMHEDLKSEVEDTTPTRFGKEHVGGGRATFVSQFDVPHAGNTGNSPITEKAALASKGRYTGIAYDTFGEVEDGSESRSQQGSTRGEEANESKPKRMEWGIGIALGIIAIVTIGAVIRRRR